MPNPSTTKIITCVEIQISPYLRNVYLWSHHCKYHRPWTACPSRDSCANGQTHLLGTFLILFSKAETTKTGLQECGKLDCPNQGT